MRDPAAVARAGRAGAARGRDLPGGGIERGALRARARRDARRERRRHARAGRRRARGRRDVRVLLLRVRVRRRPTAPTTRSARSARSTSTGARRWRSSRRCPELTGRRLHDRAGVVRVRPRAAPQELRVPAVGGALRGPRVPHARRPDRDSDRGGKRRRGRARPASQAGERGVFHVAGAERMLRSDLARVAAEELGLDPALVRPVADGRAGPGRAAAARRGPADRSRDARPRRRRCSGRATGSGRCSPQAPIAVSA